MTTTHDYPIYVFVYGTLRPGQFRSGLLEDYQHCGRGTVNGNIYDLGSFPGAKFNEQGTIIGDVYRIPPEVVATLDFIEAEGYLYKRVSVDVSMEDGYTISAYAYEFMKPITEECVLIPYGDYLDYSKE